MATLDSSVIWQGFIDALPVERDWQIHIQKRGIRRKVSKEITEMLKDQFGATRPKHKGKKSNWYSTYPN